MGLKQNITTDCKEIYLSGGFYETLLEEVENLTVEKVEFETTVGCTDADPFTFTFVPNYVYQVSIPNDVQDISGGDTLINLVFDNGTSNVLTPALDLFNTGDHPAIISEIKAFDSNIISVEIELVAQTDAFPNVDYVVTIVSSVTYTTIEINGDRQFGAGPLVPETNALTLQGGDGTGNCYVEILEEDTVYAKLTAKSFDIIGCDDDIIALPDNIYTIKAVATYTDGSTASSSICLFADCTIKCQIAEKMAKDPGSDKFDDLLICYDGVRYNAECCRCCTAYDLLVDLQDKVGNLGKCPC